MPRTPPPPTGLDALIAVPEVAFVISFAHNVSDVLIREGKESLSLASDYLTIALAMVKKILKPFLEFEYIHDAAIVFDVFLTDLYNNYILPTVEYILAIRIDLSSVQTIELPSDIFDRIWLAAESWKSYPSRLLDHFLGIKRLIVESSIWLADGGLIDFMKDMQRSVVAFVRSETFQCIPPVLLIVAFVLIWWSIHESVFPTFDEFKRMKLKDSAASVGGADTTAAAVSSDGLVPPSPRKVGMRNPAQKGDLLKFAIKMKAKSAEKATRVSPSKPPLAPSSFKNPLSKGSPNRNNLAVNTNGKRPSSPPKIFPQSPVSASASPSASPSASKSPTSILSPVSVPIGTPTGTPKSRSSSPARSGSAPRASPSPNGHSRNGGREYIDSEVDVMSMGSGDTDGVSVYSRMDSYNAEMSWIMRTSRAEPRALIGWRISVPGKGTGVVLDIKKRLGRTTQFKVQFEDGKLEFLKLKRSSNKGNVPFSPLGKL